VYSTVQMVHKNDKIGPNKVKIINKERTNIKSNLNSKLSNEKKNHVFFATAT